MIGKMCITSLLIALFAFFWLVPLCQKRRADIFEGGLWLNLFIIILFALFVGGVIGAFIFAILMIWH